MLHQEDENKIGQNCYPPLESEEKRWNCYKRLAQANVSLRDLGDERLFHPFAILFALGWLLFVARVQELTSEAHVNDQRHNINLSLRRHPQQCYIKLFHIGVKVAFSVKAAVQNECSKIEVQSQTFQHHLQRSMHM